jgi:methanogenic corrinoid protein MtbC1
MSEGKKQIIFKKLAEAVLAGNKDMVEEAAKETLTSGIEAGEAIIEGLAKGMRIAGAKYETKEYFLPNVLLSAEVMYTGLKILLPNTTMSETEENGETILGLMEGDIHYIGKNTVKTMLTTCQYCQAVDDVKMLVDSIMAAVERMKKEEKKKGLAAP